MWCLKIHSAHKGCRITNPSCACCIPMTSRPREGKGVAAFPYGGASLACFLRRLSSPSALCPQIWFLPWTLPLLAAADPFFIALQSEVVSITNMFLWKNCNGLGFELQICSSVRETPTRILFCVNTFPWQQWQTFLVRCQTFVMPNIMCLSFLYVCFCSRCHNYVPPKKLGKL